MSGAALSIGQRQLIAFARALLADPRLLILDEATSSVDIASEAVIEEAVARLLAGRTAFVVAHRLWHGRVALMEPPFGDQCCGLCRGTPLPFFRDTIWSRRGVSSLLVA